MDFFDNKHNPVGLILHGVEENDCLLACPYLTSARNIAGIVVVSATRMIREEFLGR